MIRKVNDGGHVPPTPTSKASNGFDRGALATAELITAYITPGLIDNTDNVLGRFALTPKEMNDTKGTGSPRTTTKADTFAARLVFRNPSFQRNVARHLPRGSMAIVPPAA